MRYGACVCTRDPFIEEGCLYVKGEPPHGQLHAPEGRYGTQRWHCAHLDAIIKSPLGQAQQQLNQVWKGWAHLVFANQHLAHFMYVSLLDEKACTRRTRASFSPDS